MQMFGNLFLRMFIAFWLMNIAVLGSWLLASNYFESQPPEMSWGDNKKAKAPHRFMLGVIYNLENLDEAGLQQALDNLYKEHKIRVFLVRGDNTDLLQRAVPDPVAHMVDRLRTERRRFLVSSPKSRMAAYRINRIPDGELSAVFVFPERRGIIFNLLGNSMSLRIALAVAISGIVCYVLSKLMTSRLKDLQLASRQLASGELDARLQVRERGGDETDELARDFNTMAGQLQARIQTQRRLMGDVSHELRSPLARLRIALALAQEKPANRAEYMQRIEQEAGRLEELIGQLLASQPQDAVLDMHVDLVALLAQLCADANFEGQGTGKQFSFEADTGQAIVDSAGDLLRKSFENILRNALQHTAENSQVHVALSSHYDRFQVVIEDHGPGVPEAELENIFGEFYRVDTARTRESGGYGLGLAIARRALLEHGGNVFAENTGTGLRITVNLPRDT
jgi:signal transduction histidine kinase